MPNSLYIKGRKKEYKIVNEEKSKGCISFRSAGSHSPIDVISIDLKEHTIKLIQCKPDSMSEKTKQNLKNKILKQAEWFLVDFEVV